MQAIKERNQIVVIRLIACRIGNLEPHIGGACCFRAFGCGLDRWDMVVISDKVGVRERLGEQNGALTVPAADVGYGGTILKFRFDSIERRDP
jgi:hypothetical protein